MGAAHEALCPSAERSVPLGHIGQRRAGSVDQLSAQIVVAALADAQELRLAAGGELSRNQAEPGRKIAAAVEAFRLTDGGDKRGGDKRAEAGDRRQSTGRFVLLRPADELGVEGRDPPVELSPLRASVGDEQSDPRAKSRLRLVRP
jgi:hypothetical protein